MTSLHNRLTITAALAAVLSLTLSACQRGGDEAAGPVGSGGTQTAAPDRGSAGGAGMGSGTQSPSPGGTGPSGGSETTSSPATAASSPRTP